MMTKFETYAETFETVRMLRSDDGVLEISLHTEGAEFVWSLGGQRELARLWQVVADDPDNRVVILTGTGASFIHEGGVFPEEGWITPSVWKEVHSLGRRLVLNHLNVEVPIIAAVNGPATLHSEQALLCDIIIADESAVFADRAHFSHGIVPGDGIQVIWPYLIGLNRGRYMFLMDQEFTSHEARDLGVINEVVPVGESLHRAREIANRLVRKPTVALRSVRQLFLRELRTRMDVGVDVGLMMEGIAGMEHWPSSHDQTARHDGHQ